MGNEKMTSDTGGQIRFAAHRVIAKKVYHALGVLHDHQFEEVDWPHVYDALHGVPRLFQIWACKQVMDIAPTVKQLSQVGRTRSLVPLLPRLPRNHSAHHGLRGVGPR